MKVHTNGQDTELSSPFHLFPEAVGLLLISCSEDDYIPRIGELGRIIGVEKLSVFDEFAVLNAGELFRRGAQVRPKLFSLHAAAGGPAPCAALNRSRPESAGPVVRVGRFGAQRRPLWRPMES
jgi:hypothetical protein